MKIRIAFFTIMVLLASISTFSLAYDNLPSIIKTELPGKIAVVFNGQLDVITLKTGVQQLVTMGQEWGMERPTLSPTASELVYVGRHFTNADASNPVSDIFKMTVDGSNLVQLTQNMGVNSYPQWTNGEQSIIFKSTQAGISNIFSIDIDGTNLIKLSDFEAADWDFWDLNLSPDGQKIAFVSDRGYRIPQPDGTFFSKSTRVSIADIADGKISRIVDITSGDDCGAGDFYRTPMWSPDGNILAVSFGCAPYTGEIYLFNQAEISENGSIKDAKKLMERDSRNQIIEGFSWSPDGANIAFVNHTSLEDYSKSYDNLMVVSVKAILEMDSALAIPLTLNEKPQYRYMSPSWR